MKTFQTICTKICTLSFLIGVIIFSTPIAVAHTLQISGTVGAVLHVDPNDNPRAGENAKIFFDFKDTANKLDLSMCDCKVTVEKKDPPANVEQIIQNSEIAIEKNVLSYSHIFESPGIYILRVVGAPKESAQFKDFAISFDIRVEQAHVASTEKPFISISEHRAHIVLFGGAILSVLWLIVSDKSSKRGTIEKINSNQ